MTRKQMKRIAQRIHECELIHESKTATKEEIARADNEVYQIGRQLGCLKDGLNIMMEIDEMVLTLREKQQQQGE